MGVGYRPSDTKGSRLLAVCCIGRQSLHNSQHPEVEEVEEKPVKKRRPAKKQPTAKEIAQQEALKLANNQDLQNRNLKTLKQ